jgi:ribosomal protein S27AE/DNA repair exonuclease SbcCD ATPase subunit
MPEKEYRVPLGERKIKATSDPALETIRQAQAERERKRLERENEKEEIKHMREIEEERARLAKAKREAEASEQSVQKSPVEFEPVKIDIEGEKKRLHEALEQERQRVEQARSEVEKTKEELAAERQRRLEDKFSELTDELRAIREGKGGARTADQVIEEAVKTAEKLGYAKTGTPQVSPEVQLQLKKMETDLQLRLEEMRDERDRRDKEWQLTLKKWEDEKALRTQELEQKARADREKMEFLSSAQQRIGRIIAGMLKGGGSISSGGSGISKSYHIEAEEGSEGEVECPGCSQSIFVAPDASKVICDGCGQEIEVKRVATGKVGEES